MNAQLAFKLSWVLLLSASLGRNGPAGGSYLGPSRWVPVPPVRKYDSGGNHFPPLHSTKTLHFFPLARSRAQELETNLIYSPIAIS